MKKYLMSGIAALSITAAFTSCSHDDEGFSSIEDLKVAQFETAFKARYGNIDSNNDWGFDNFKVNTTRAAVAGRANVYTDYHAFTTAPDAPDASVFKSAPAGMEETARVNESNGTFVIGASTKFVNLWGTGSTLYVVGNCSPTENFYIGANSKIYILNGGKLNLGQFSFGQSGCEIYVAEGGELNSTAQLQFSGTKLINNGTVTAVTLDIVSQGTLAYVYNCSKGVINVSQNISMSGAGTYIVNDNSIVAVNIGVTSGSFVYNNEGATLNLSGTLGIENNNCEVVNKGTLNAETLNTHGSAHFVNEDTGIVEIGGYTNIDSNNDTWVNNGQYTTNNFNFQATSSEVINNCKLTVIDKFYIGLSQDASGDFKLDGSVITKDFELHGPANIHMTSQSVILVSNIATMDITIPNFGIYGPTSGEYSVFQAKKVVTSQVSNFCVSYFNKLYVVADEHFGHAYLDGTSAAAQANGGEGNSPTYYYDINTVKMCVNGAAKPNYTIPSSKCNPGFKGDENEIEYAVRIICEDLGAADDYDFNDVVFDALIKDNKTYIKVVAAGGTLPLTIAGTEVHGLFNENTNVMINTAKGEHSKSGYREFVVDQAYASYKDIPVVVTIPATASTNESLLTLQAEKGSAPQKIAVKTNFEWCDERQQIENKYTNFPTYVTNSQALWQ